MITIKYTKDLFRNIHQKKRIADTRNTLRTHHYIEKEKQQKYIFGLLSIVIDEPDLENRTNQLMNDMRNFNN